jgi:hypothetical protein
MDTKKIRELLPDYVRNRLPAKEHAIIESAVRADPTLMAECTGLKEYFDSLKVLTPLKAPPGFATNVMRRINQVEEKRSILSTIFKPFPIKLPLEATAVIVTAMLLIWIYYPAQKNNFSVVDENSFPSESVTPIQEIQEQKQAMPAPSVKKETIKIVRTRRNKPNHGDIRYMLQLPLASYDSFMSALSKEGMVSVDKETVSGNQSGDITIILIIKKNR